MKSKSDFSRFRIRIFETEKIKKKKFLKFLVTCFFSVFSNTIMIQQILNKILNSFKSRWDPHITIY